MIKAQSQNARILRALADGRWHSVAQIHRRAGTSRLNSRVSELRSKHGFTIEHERLPGRNGALGHRYRLVNPPPAAELKALFDPHPAPVLTLVRDEIPRNLEHRYRVYRMVYDELELLGTASEPEEVGLVIIQLGEQGAFNHSCIGLLDTHGTDEEPGTWIVHPWDVTP